LAQALLKEGKLEEAGALLDRLIAAEEKAVERAAYEAERAARHYRLSAPEHRFVARQLAKEGEDKRRAQRLLPEA